MHVYLIGTVAVIAAVSLALAPSSSDIPPTPAFYQIVLNNTNITSTSYNDVLRLESDGSILISAENKTLTFKVGAPGSDRLGGVIAAECDAGHYVAGIDLTGHITCRELPE